MRAQRVNNRSLAVLALAFLSGCGGGGNNNSSGDTVGGGGGGGGGNSACVSITGGGSQVTASADGVGCADCNVSNESAAVDDDLSTFATLTVNGASPGHGALIRATAQPGVVFPAGQKAGAYVSVPAGTGQTYTVTINTYLTGTLQETNSSDNSQGGVLGGHGSSFDGIATTKQFDSVEVFVNNNQAGGTPEFHVYEICSDHSSS